MLMLKAMAAVFALGALAFLSLFTLLLWKEHSTPPPAKADVLIVLGAQVKADGRPSEQLRLRLETALDAYREVPAPVIVCGAQGADEPASEARVMRDWLVLRGASPEHVLMDEDSYDTAQSLSNAKTLIPDGAGSVLIITSDYHLPRALAIARDIGLEASGMKSPTTREFWLKNHIREALAWGKYLLMKGIPF